MSVRKRSDGFDRENRFVLRLNFLENVGLNCAAQFRNNFRTETPFGRRDVHRHDDRRRAADRHRRGEIRRAKIESVVEPHHVFDSVDRHAAFADFAEDAVCVAVDSVKCRAIKRRAEPMRALMLGQIMKTLVRVLSQHQTRRTNASAPPVAAAVSAVLFAFAGDTPAATALSFSTAFDFAHRLKIHLAIGRRSEYGNSPGKSFAKDDNARSRLAHRFPATQAAAMAIRSACASPEFSL